VQVTIPKNKATEFY